MPSFKPALILRPAPTAETGAHTPHFAGGSPYMPEDMPWPEDPRWGPLSFLMQLDLSQVPRTVSNGTESLSVPQLPDHGTLYVFFEGSNDFDGTPGVHLRYTPLGPEHFKPRGHENLPDLTKADPCFVDEDGVQTDTKVMRTFTLDPVPYPQPHAYWPSPEDWDEDEDDAARARRGAVLKQVLGGRKAIPEPPVYRFPWLPQVSEWCANLDAGQCMDIPKDFPWRSDLVREIAKSLKTLAEPEHPTMRHFNLMRVLWPGHDALCDSWLTHMKFKHGTLSEDDAHAFTNWLLWLDSPLDRIPVLKPLTQDAVETARTQNKDFFSLVEKREKRGMFLKPDVLAALQDLEKVAVLHTEDRRDAVFPLLNVHTARDTLRKTLHGVLQDTFERFVTRLPTDKDVGDTPPVLIEHGRWAHARKLDVKEDKLKIDRVLQMFGDGDEEPGPEGHVLLLQLASDFGLPIHLHGSASQVWITPEDLAAGRFESALHVTEMS